MTPDATQARLALRRAAGRTSAVRFLAVSSGGYAVYCVGSSRDAEMGYRVTVDRDGVYRCTCESELRPACWHRASVFLVRVQRSAAGLALNGPTLAERETRADAGRRLEEIEREFAR